MSEGDSLQSALIGAMHDHEYAICYPGESVMPLSPLCKRRHADVNVDLSNE